jgi:nucleoid DNA-binding protein
MKKYVKKNAKTKDNLFEEIHQLLESYGITTEKVADAIEQSLLEVKRDGCSVHKWLLPMVFRRIFGGFILIRPRTAAGNAIPLDILTVAYTVWREAQLAAIKRGLDELDAAEALANIVNTITDRLARGTDVPIRNIRNYMFTGYMNELKRIAEKNGIFRSGDGNPKNLLSDDGALMDELENRILCGQIVNSLSDTVEKAAVLRYLRGYSCKETAALLGLSNCAARKAISMGIRKIFGRRMRELRELGYVEMRKAKKKRL